MSTPNSWAKANVKNDFGEKIFNVTLNHRYDSDHYDNESWDSLDNGETSSDFSVGYWTGFGRTGKDYWFIQFEAGGRIWTCKDNFYCYLTADDKNKAVTCRVYKDGSDGKMEIICPRSSNCTASLDDGIANPNSWAMVYVQNNWGSEITNVQLNHRYDNDHYDAESWKTLANDATSPGLRVGFWTGFGRTGKDYWLIRFEAEGKVWTCKDNFYCFLTSHDKDKDVKLRLYKDGEDGKMQAMCPESSNCTVRLSSEVIHNGPRPVYVIAHRCNDSEDIGRAISQGCNALECDLQYNSTSKEVFVNHDSPTGNNLSKWLNNAKTIIGIYPTQFSLIIFDCKFASDDFDQTGDVLVSVRQQVREFLNKDVETPINILFSIASYKRVQGFRKIMNTLRPNEGVAIDQSDDPEEVTNFFRDNEVANFWYGDGIFSAGTKDVYPYVKKGCELRDTVGFPRKVYVWTLAKGNSIKKYIEEALVDAVMVNVPGTIPLSDNGLAEALKVIYESDICHMAEKTDNAFSLFKNPS